MKNFRCVNCSFYKDFYCNYNGEARKVHPQANGYEEFCPIFDAIKYNIVWKCKFCNKETVWINRKRKKSILIEANSYHGEKYFNKDVHSIHYKNCLKNLKKERK